MERRASKQARHVTHERQNGGSPRDVQRGGERGRHIRAARRRQHLRGRRRGRRRHARPHRQLQETRSRLRPTTQRF